MKVLFSSKILNNIAPTIVSTFVAVICALALDYLYELFSNEEVHTVHLIRTYFIFFSYPFIPAMLGGFCFAIISNNFKREILLINTCLLTFFFLFFQKDLNPSERFVVIFIVFLPLIYIGFFTGNYLGKRIKKLF